MVYEEGHGLRGYSNSGVHRRFLRRLNEVLPEGFRPIVVGEAGFRICWFKEMEALGSAWVGRVRGDVKVRGWGGEWMAARALYGEATPAAQSLGSWGRSLSAASARYCLTYVLIQFVLLPDNTFLSFPVHHDDYANLSHSSNDLRLRSRSGRFLVRAGRPVDNGHRPRRTVRESGSGSSESSGTHCRCAPVVNER